MTTKQQKKKKKKTKQSENGLSLEYFAVYKLSKFTDLRIELTDEAKDFLRDYRNDVKELRKKDPDRYQALRSGGQEVAYWVKSVWLTDRRKKFIVDRSKDRADGAWDIRVCNQSHEVLKISLKHNNSHLKHNRPEPLIETILQSMGCRRPKGSTLAKKHRDELGLIKEEFKRRSPHVRKFTAVPKKSRNLNRDFCNRCCQSLRTLKKSHGAQVLARDLFNFFLDPESLVVRVDTTRRNKRYKTIEIYDLSSITKPRDVRFSVRPANKKEYALKLHFDNDWRVSLRLHWDKAEIPRVGTAFPFKFDATLDMPLVKIVSLYDPK